MPSVALLLATLPVVAYDYDFEENGIYYRYVLSAAEDEFTLGVVSINDKKTSVYLVIPDTVYIDEVPYKVSTICEGAFKKIDTSTPYPHLSTQSVTTRFIVPL